MVVREVYEVVTDSLVSFEERLLTTRALRGIRQSVATVIPIESVRRQRGFSIGTRSVCNPNILLCTASHQSRSMRGAYIIPRGETL
jgi:hypothetical protein